MSGLELRSKVRRAYRSLLRRRPYHLKIRVIDASTDYRPSGAAGPIAGASLSVREGQSAPRDQRRPPPLGAVFW